MGAFERYPSLRRKLALIIGNDEYNESYNKLENSKKNANDLSASLKTINFDVDTYVDLTRVKFHKHIIEFSKKINDGDLILFYFAGHGFQFNDKNYFIPSDAEIEVDKDVELFGIDAQRTLERFFKKNRSYATIFILDCCRPYLLKNIEKSKIIPNIPRNAHWGLNAYTVAGGRGPGSTFNRLHFPKGLFVNQNQAIFIADSSNHRIMKYNRHAVIGQRLYGQRISGYRLDQLNDPSNVIFDINSKSFIICDNHNRRVLRYFHRRRPYVTTITENIQCYGVAMDNEGSIYVSNAERHEVRRYGADEPYGVVVAGGNGQGRRLQQLSHPTYIFVDKDQSVYVSDSWNDRVIKWSKDTKEGVIVAGGRGQGSNRTQLNNPTGIVVDRLGTVYVADQRNNRVMRWYDSASYGDVIAGGLIPGDHANQLNRPEGLAFDRLGNLFVADSSNHRIQLFRILAM
ncbi:unnamed protein product [Rotaria magnacalcarata]|uniref:Caspase family p20 domain-containing protein n=4 Tax=Rotaria magnacalcarata TaxID=392030 RepID=A0A814XDL3_9BILA|nr:unnamed protein product [Rotaria magnacalcarata]CAF1349839.1 unnamed protein product [Rotaria magnacalcarata]CAF3838367.1 unnamed protein product [Rotaria magnacalcarata]CAF3870747.1 unnamed protein product [Rotaria magnacalcarata]